MRYLFLLSVLGIALFYSCSDKNVDDEDGDGNETLTLNQSVNTFLEGHFKKEYLWAAEIKSKSPSKSLEPATYFSGMTHSGDKWSRLTDEPQEGEIAAASEGYDYGYGFLLTVWTSSETTIIGAKVNHVYPGSPAARAGIQRGDMITKIDGSSISSANQDKLISGSNVSFEVWKKMDKEDTKTYVLTSGRFTVTPILKDTIFTYEGKRIGYLYYASFTYSGPSDTTDLSRVFKKFKGNVDEFIFDLRYNGGGYSNVATHIASLLAPSSVVDQEDILIYKQWNKDMQNAVGQANREERFNKNVPVGSRLGLSKLWFITTASTASSSELLISGLWPSMGKENIRTVGGTTHGKNAGGLTYSPKENDLKNWHAYLITMTYTNKNSQSVSGGISATYPFPGSNNKVIYDDISDLGDPTDPYIAKVLELITGKSPLSRAPSETPRQAYTATLLGNPTYLIFE